MQRANFKHWFTATAVLGYATGRRNVRLRYCSNGSSFCNTQVISSISFTTTHSSYAITYKTEMPVGTEIELIYYPGRTRLLGRFVASTILVPKPFRGRRQRRWTAARR